MKNKGFTLVEILAVIVVLGLLAAIITPTVNNLIKDSEETLEKKQINTIINATKKYVVENSELLPDSESENAVYIETTTLLEEGMIDKENIINPKTKEEMWGCVIINYSQSYNQYNYEYIDGCITNWKYEYTGNYEKTTVPFEGYYKLEVWGAQGGHGGYSANSIAGHGGYSTGIVYLNANDILYVNVGGQGTGQISDFSGNNVNIGGYNGGGNNYNTSGQASSGGGATDIRLFYNSLYSRIIVAGGGGGNGYGSDSATGGFGGGLTGTNGSGYSSYNNYGYGATQIAGGGIKTTGSNQGYTNTPGTFGQGGIGIGNSHGGGGGGGGWYGGGGGIIAGGGGGSSWIFTEETFATWQTGNPIDAAEYLLDSKYYLSEATTINGNSLMPNHDGTSTMTGNTGNGYAKITFLSKKTQ